MTALHLAVLTLLGVGLAGCSATYKTGPDGVPVGTPDVTYMGPGAGVGGLQLEGPAAAPPPGLPPPANLTAPATP